MKKREKIAKSAKEAGAKYCLRGGVKPEKATLEDAAKSVEFVRGEMK